MRLPLQRWTQYVQLLWQGERGAAVVLIAAFTGALMALAALAADLGVLMAERHRITAAVDMASLSGAQLLPEFPDAAEFTARRILTENGYDGQAAKVEIGSDLRRINVTMETVRATAFARTFGISTVDVAGGTGAYVSNLSGVWGAVPLGVPRGSYLVGQSVTLKLASQSGAVGPGNFQALAFALDSRGGSDYQENLANGYQNWVRIDQWIDTEPGAKSGPTRKGIQERMDADPNATWDTVRRYSKRLVVVPMLEDWEVNGRDQVRVVGFAAFFVETTQVNGGQVEITGRFLRYIIEGEASASAPDFGARTVKLGR